jgi:isoleucyl-tRNA synthetase
MADGLARLLAPILPVTADELWRHIPGAREESVHLAEFPKEVDALIDVDLEARWTRLREIRDKVNGALETARQEKLIGTSLAARAALTAGGETAALLRRYEPDLPMLFIVSQVTLDTTGPEGVSVAVARAEGEKCERCWRVVSEVSRNPGTEGLCSRCIDALPAGDPSTGLGTGGGREVA